MVNDLSTMFVSFLQSIFTQLHQIQTHSSHTLRKTSHTIILNFHLPPSSMLRSFIFFPLQFCDIWNWNFFYKIIAKLVKFALGKKKRFLKFLNLLVETITTIVWGRKKHLSCQLQKVTILQQPTNFKEAVPPIWGSSLKLSIWNLCRWPKSKKSSLQLVLPGSQFGV
jgi:hypothetical protein